MSDGRLARRAPDFIAASHRAWALANGAPPLAAPFRTGGWSTPGRTVSVTPGDGQPRLAIAPDGGALPLLPAPVTGPDGAPWGALLRAPDSEDGLPEATTRLTALAGLPGAARPALAAVHGGAALTRALLYEEARLRHGLPALLIDPGLDQDQAVTAVLPGRADLVGVPAENAMIRS